MEKQPRLVGCELLFVLDLAVSLQLSLYSENQLTIRLLILKSRASQKTPTNFTINDIYVTVGVACRNRVYNSQESKRGEGGLEDDEFEMSVV